MNALCRDLAINKVFSSVGLFRHVQRHLNSSRTVRNRAVTLTKVYRTLSRFLNIQTSSSMTLLVLGKLVGGYTTRFFPNFTEEANHVVYCFNSSREATNSLNRAGITVINISNLSSDNIARLQIIPTQIL